MEKFIYVFSEEDKNTLLDHGFVLAKEPRKVVSKKKATEETQADKAVKKKKEMKVWIFYNEATQVRVLDSLSEYALSNILTF